VLKNLRSDKQLLRSLCYNIDILEMLLAFGADVQLLVTI